jgi:hypothetical protein
MSLAVAHFQVHEHSVFSRRLPGGCQRHEHRLCVAAEYLVVGVHAGRLSGCCAAFSTCPEGLPLLS